MEGALLRFLFRGPLHWLHVLDLAEPSAGDDLLISLNPWGARWLGLDVPQPHEPPRHPLTVGEDFRITLPLRTPLLDRFRVERFANWEASYPQFVYQITQRSLKRAAAEGIHTGQILQFLRSRSRTLPERVVQALERFQGR
ncbi:hypothetical protein RY27_10465 [Litorilinea aerophila]|nr:hypothetical protein RY27_10465 [Litorilinea aerophila]